MSIRWLAAALKEAARWADWELESLELFHAYAHRFGSVAGSNVYLFVLKDALRSHGLTIEQFKESEDENEHS